MGMPIQLLLDKQPSTKIEDRINNSNVRLGAKTINERT